MRAYWIAAQIVILWSRDRRPAILAMSIIAGADLAAPTFTCGCCDQSLRRFRQTIAWDSAISANLERFKRLHGRIAAQNTVWGSDPTLIT